MAFVSLIGRRDYDATEPATNDYAVRSEDKDNALSRENRPHLKFENEANTRPR
jgi:hypothetical protein